MLTEEMRTQVNRGFTPSTTTSRSSSFISPNPATAARRARLVIHVQNTGSEPVALTPRQVIITDGTIGTVHEMESTLGRRVLEERWDRPFESVTIALGRRRRGRLLQAVLGKANGADSSSNVNCFGIVRADVKAEGGGPANLEVSVVAIDGTPALTTLGKQAAAHLQSGARVAGGLLRPSRPEPAGCQLRRAAGVVRDFAFRSEMVTVDVDALASETLRFQMALPAVQSRECPRGPADIRLHPLPQVQPPGHGRGII
jgi:hypothetical protein